MYADAGGVDRCERFAGGRWPGESGLLAIAGAVLTMGKAARRVWQLRPERRRATTSRRIGAKGRSNGIFSMAPSRGPEPLARALHTTLENHKGPVHVARYAKGSAKYVLTGGQDRVVRLWNPSLGTEIKSYSAHGYEVLSISV